MNRLWYLPGWSFATVCAVPSVQDGRLDRYGSRVPDDQLPVLVHEPATAGAVLDRLRGEQTQ